MIIGLSHNGKWVSFHDQSGTHLWLILNLSEPACYFLVYIMPWFLEAHIPQFAVVLSKKSLVVGIDNVELIISSTA
jgi:hypothetical protein